jgi:hypothetical protein
MDGLLERVSKKGFEKLSKKEKDRLIEITDRLKGS